MRLFSFFFYYDSGETRTIPFLIFGLLGIIWFTSCGTIKNSAYFKTLKKDTTLQGFVKNDFVLKIQKKDILGITVSSLSKDMDEQFNAVSLVSNQAEPQPGYLVNERGQINLHFIGTVTAEGSTRQGLKNKIEEALLPYMKEPIILIKYLNHKVTVLGEVASPQVINMPEEQLSLIDLIVKSGDVKENANRADIMIIREEENEKKVKHVNLEDQSIFTSSWYYVLPNDIIYVLPDNERYVKEEKRKKIQTTLSLVASLASLVVILLNVILR